MAVSTEDLEEQQGDELELAGTGAEAAEGSEGEGGDALEDQAQSLAKQETAVERELANLQRQLSRVESRFDKGQDAASVRQIRADMANLQQQLSGLGELRETVDTLLEASLPPEKVAALRVKQAETRASRAEQRAKTLETEHATREVDLPSARGPQAGTVDAAIQEAATILDRRMRRLNLNPDDQDTQKRMIALVPGLGQMSPAERLNALTDVLPDLVESDQNASAQATRRTAARGAVRTDRSNAGSANGSGTTTYASYTELSQALMDGAVSVDFVRAEKAKHGW